MDRLKLIEKVEKQNGYVDIIDAYRICSVYTDIFGYSNMFGKQDINKLPVLEQLIIMYDEIKKHTDSDIKKVCSECGKEKNILDFYKSSSNRDGYYKSCKYCSLKKNKK